MAGEFMMVNKAFEYLPGKCLKVDNQGSFWSEAQNYCNEIKHKQLGQSTDPDKLSLLKDALESKGFTTIDVDPKWYMSRERVKGVWKWKESGTSTITDLNWIYEYWCKDNNKGHGYICQGTEGKDLAPYEYQTGRCLKIEDNEQVWNDARNYCNTIIEDYPDKLSLLKTTLNSTNISSKSTTSDSWMGFKRVKGIWKWNGEETLNLNHSNWIYEYRCSQKDGYICEAAPENVTDPCSPFGSSINIGLLVLIFILLGIVLGLIVYTCSLKRRRKACSTEVNEMKDTKEGHNNKGNVINRHDSENSLYEQY